MKFQKYKNAVKYLETLASSAHDLQYMKKRTSHPEHYLERTKELFRLLKNPQKGFNYIHITGTSGKGSTVAYLHEILNSAGFKTGAFTSPYCATSIEKIKCQNKFISPYEFSRITSQIKPIIKKMEKEYKYGRPSYFEIFLAIAILYFKKTKCDWVILEVGCGGKYDASNIIESSISAITNIGLDHEHILGKTKQKIAKEKAGIIKPGSHFFTTEKDRGLLDMFKKICKNKKAKFHKISPKGKFQTANKSLAQAVARHIGISKNVIKKSISKTNLPPCRFEIVQKKPIVILDGAHNPDKIKSVVHSLKNLTYGKLYIIFSACITKNAEKMIKQISPLAHEIIFTEFEASSRQSYSAEVLSRIAGKLTNKRAQPRAQKALLYVLGKMKANDALLITGSFYLTGKLRKNWISEEKMLLKRKQN